MAGVKASAFFYGRIPSVSVRGILWSEKRKVGTGWGQNDQARKKGIAEKYRNPLISMVGQGRIELPTHGFSVRCSTD
jgi:hypothetical protein